ncbi:secretin N-terminal domain-containing protein [Undibacterium sp.]|uniref:secretin N-terminal domain-containing protein n=1 Tax=Undibacterium sp. TaxID=1914977 RepID=UPI002C48A063|nr:secretin N-terminal domain-containing protein [Undibacterium sp.]HTD06010.1 secretin N-terminal domain-containing protein [Undibacterium sp.]
MKQEADAALAKNDLESARLKLTDILTENPDSEPALALLRSLKEKTAAANAEITLSSAYRKPISIEFRDAPLKQVFDIISRTSGLNFIFDKDVRTEQRTSLSLKNSTIESAIHFALMTNQLERQVLDPNTILIYPNVPAKLKDYQEMKVRTFYLTNAEAKKVAETLKTIVKTRDIVVDEKLNLIIMRDSPDAIKMAEKLVALQDLAEPEVMLEVEVLEVKRTRLQQLGIQWPGTLSLTPLPLGSLTEAGGSTSQLSLYDLLHQNNRTLNAKIGSVTANANLQDGDANLLANPRIRARNHEKASILIGEKVPNISSTATSTGFVSENVQYVEVGLKLNVEPTVYMDNEVAIKVSMEVSNIIDQLKTPSGTTAYRIGTRTASTVLRLKNGETQVLAGLINDEERRSGNRVPGVGELPVLGRLFGNGTDDTQKTEIVLSITPHLIRNIQRPLSTEAEFQAGTENNLRNKPDMRPSVSPEPAANTPAPSGPGALLAAPSAIPTANTDTGNAAGTTNNPATAVDPNAALQMFWLGPSQVKAGENVSVALSLRSNQPVAELPITIGYDNKQLQFVNIAEGEFLKRGNATTSFKSQLSADQITISSHRTDGSAAVSAGNLAILTFRALAPTDATQIKVLNAVALGAGKRNIGAVASSHYNLKIVP